MGADWELVTSTYDIIVILLENEPGEISVISLPSSNS